VRILTQTVIAAVLALVVLPQMAVGSEATEAAANVGRELPVASVIPFVLMLGAIAILPLAAPHWWEHNRNRAIVAAVLAVPLVIYVVLSFGSEGVEKLEHVGMEYLSFVLLLGSLFVISGGIYVQGSLSGTPLVNTGMIGLGGILASFIGTTGASVVLIRPILRANASRGRKTHVVVFFIFVVSNCGGLLTPLGDPPLFLGFLKGVPFGWTLYLWPEWLLVNFILLVVFNIYDQVQLNREERERLGSQLEQVMKHEPLRIIGLHNVAFLAAIVLVIYAAGEGWGSGGQSWPYGIQEALMAAVAVAAYLSTRSEIRELNRFTFGPIIEVAVLFAGIFVTMAPALAILNSWGKGEREVLGFAFGMSEPWQYFWATGILSSFLDNAPTYLTFAATAAGTAGVSTEGRYLAEFLLREGGPEVLAAISCGAVFMGANTYIGNGPNFMVRAIAEESGVRMPSFFGYMVYSVAILIPIFVVVTFVFFG
jgi:Na+/H+ antiporter NhaD/arsenite permease-like protein